MTAPDRPTTHPRGGSSSVRVAAVVPAAGRGVRLGAGTVKALVQVRGTSLLRRCVDGLTASGVVDLVVVVAPPELLARVRAELAPQVLVVAGGAERTDSVRAGLAEVLRVAPGAEHVLVHDAARSLTPPGLVRAVVAALRAGAVAVVPALPVADTIKNVDADGVVTATPDRAGLRAVQTPQGFAAGLLHEAYAGAVPTDVVAGAVVGAVAGVPAGVVAVTDDAGLAERVGAAVHTVPGDPLAFKITTATDLVLAEALLGPDA